MHERVMTLLSWADGIACCVCEVMIALLFDGGGRVSIGGRSGGRMYVSIPREEFGESYFHYLNVARFPVSADCRLLHFKVPSALFGFCESGFRWKLIPGPRTQPLHSLGVFLQPYFGLCDSEYHRSSPSLLSRAGGGRVFNTCIRTYEHKA